jgi:hypothetical protein
MPLHTQRRRQHHAAAVAAAALLALLGVCAAAAVEIELAPASKWTQCIDDGRLNIRLAVHGKLHAGLQLPEHAESCKPSKPTSCKWLAACDASTDCRKFIPGELSGESSRQHLATMQPLTHACASAQVGASVQL